MSKINGPEQFGKLVERQKDANAKFCADFAKLVLEKKAEILAKTRVELELLLQQGKYASGDKEDAISVAFGNAMDAVIFGPHSAALSELFPNRVIDTMWGKCEATWQSIRDTLMNEPMPNP